MPLKYFLCPDKTQVEVVECLSKCRMQDRCLTLPFLNLASRDRVWNGTPSTTQLLNGTMYEFLRLTQPYTVDPKSRAFSIHGTLHHSSLEVMAKELGLPSEVALSVDRDIFDLIEPSPTGWLLSDYKTWGSYRVAKALGITQGGKIPDPSGEVYKSTGAWGKAGTPKMINTWIRDNSKRDMFEPNMQLNRYRVKLKEVGVNISKMQLQVTVRDGGLQIATGRGITELVYLIPVDLLDDTMVLGYFEMKDYNLRLALEHSCCTEPCDSEESWEGARCKDYCEVWADCPKGQLLHGR